MYLKTAVAVAVSVSLSLWAHSVSAEVTKQVKVSWYKCCNPHTASGKPFSASDPTIVAHKCLPFGTTVRFRNLKNGKTLVAQVDDRGPFVEGRMFDLTRAGADRLGIVHAGVVDVEVTWNGVHSLLCKT